MSEKKDTSIVWKNYRVVWEIDITAASPREAAKLALEIQQDPESTAIVFQVSDEKGACVEVDLNEEIEK